MGSSVLLVLLAPFFAVYLFFVGIVTEIKGPPQAEIVLPYDESQGLVWEYVDQEDYYINLVEVKVEDDKQIFVFERETITSEFFSEVILGFTEERTTVLISPKSFIAELNGDTTALTAINTSFTSIAPFTISLSALTISDSRVLLSSSQDAIPVASCMVLPNSSIAFCISTADLVVRSAAVST